MIEYSNFGDVTLIRDRVYKMLKMQIISGKARPGDTLNISELASNLNISAAPIREALNLLSKEGLVDLAPHKTPVVASGTIRDFYISVDLRKKLEPYAARLSTPLIPQEAIDAVRKQLELVLADPNNLNKYVESDLAVHELLYTFADSKILAQMLSAVKSYNMRFRYLVEKDDRTKDVSSNITVSTKEHLDIINALDSRDPEQAYQAVLRHISLYEERNHP